MRYANEIEYLENDSKTYWTWRKNSPFLLLEWEKEEGLSRRKSGKSNNKERVANQPVAIALGVPWYLGSWRWLNSNGSAIQAIAIISAVVWWFASGSFRLDQIEKSMSGIESKLVDVSTGIGKINERVTKLEGKWETFETFILPRLTTQAYKPKAFELGFVDPQIVSLNLIKSAQTRAQGFGKSGLSYQFTFTVQEAKKDYIVVQVDGDVKAQEKKSTVRGTILEIPMKIGDPVDLMKVLSEMGIFPDDFNPSPLWVTVLDFPSPNVAVLAIASKVT
jgi:hypothetical protein